MDKDADLEHSFSQSMVSNLAVGHKLLFVCNQINTEEGSKQLEICIAI
jgi:hypothetical protein